MILRPYQEVAKAAVYAFLCASDDNPCVVLPTGSGKSPLIASTCQDAVTLWRGRVLILAHVKELLGQAADKLNQVCPEVCFGVYSAGLGHRDTDASVIVAGIQSVYQRACELGPFDLVLVDEAHLIPPEGDGMYRQFLADAKVVNPHVRVVGFTATPFRMMTGPICTPEGILNAVCYEVGVRELIRDGYLCPLVSKAGQIKVDTTGLHVRGGEFVADEVEALMDGEALVRAACAEVVELTRQRHAVLIFASGIRHGEYVVGVLSKDHGVECGFVTGETPAAQRDALTSRFKAGALKYLVNVTVLTTGFDAPSIDGIVLLRPTLSPGLYSQMVGRGFRVHPHKQDCLILDFGGNVLRHGPVDQLRVQQRIPETGEAPAKECPSCHALIAAGYTFCPLCGHAFPPPEQGKHDAQASETAVLSCAVTTTWYDVEDVFYRVHSQRLVGDDAPRSLRVDERVGPHQFKTEWVCFEHQGYARVKAVEWWRRRSPDPVPDTAQRAVEVATNGGGAFPKAVCVRAIAGDPFERVIDCRLGPMPEPVPLAESTAVDDEVPF